MKLFDLDAHCSVVEDMRRQLQPLGHQVDVHNLTGHAFVFGNKPLCNWGSFKLDFIWDTKPEGIRAEHPELEAYDAFSVCYPPPLLRLFDDFQKPMIAYLPVRFDLWTSDNEDRERSWLAWVLNRHDEGRLHFASNSRYDVEYLRYYTGIEATYIPSLCDYTGLKWNPQHPTALLWDSRSERVTDLFCSMLPSQVEQVRRKYGRYEWAQVSSHRAIVHVPYNASIMSFFEHYAMGMPIFVPSPDLMLSLKNSCGAIGEITHRQCANNYPPGSFIKGRDDRPDPNEYNDLDSLRYWMRYWDFYQDWPGVKTFDSLSELGSLLRDDALLQTMSRDALASIAGRKADNQVLWQKFLEAVK